MADMVATLKCYIRESDEAVGRGANFAEGLFYFEISAIYSSGRKLVWKHLKFISEHVRFAKFFLIPLQYSCL